MEQSIPLTLCLEKEEEELLQVLKQRPQWSRYSHHRPWVIPHWSRLDKFLKEVAAWKSPHWSRKGLQPVKRVHAAAEEKV